MSKVNKIQDINQFGLDVESDIISILSDELSKSIDKEILKGMGLELEINKRRSKSIRKVFE